MKKQEKLDILQSGIQNKRICRCFFTCDANYFYYYPHAVNDKFLLGQEEDDFQLDGYCIRKISHLKKVQIKNDKCGEINRLFGVEDQVVDPQIDISSWQSIFNELKNRDLYVIIEDERHGQFGIGVIQKVTKNMLWLASFDAEGVWDAEPMEIPFPEITCVKWDCRYTQYWKRYMEFVSGRQEQDGTAAAGQTGFSN